MYYSQNCLVPSMRLRKDKLKKVSFVSANALLAVLHGYKWKLCFFFKKKVRMGGSGCGFKPLNKSMNECFDALSLS